MKLSSSGHRVSFHQLILRRRRHNKQARYKRKNRKLLDSTVKSAPSVMCTYAVDFFCGLLLFLLKVTCMFCRQLLDSQPFVFVHVLLDSAAVFASSLQCMAASITLFISFRILQYITSLLRERAAFIKSREAVMFYLLRTLQVMPSTIISNCVFDALGISSHTISASMALLSMYITENFARKAQFLSAALNIGYDDAYWQLYLSLRAIGREKYMNLCAIDVFACANGFKIFVSLPAVDGTPAQIVVLNPSGSTCVHMIVTGKRSCAHAISVSPAEFALQTASSVTSTECRSWFEWNIGHKSTDADKPASDSQRVLRSRVQKSSEFIRSCVVLCCTYYNTPYSMCSISALEKFGEVPDFDDADEQEDLEAEMIDLECDSDDDGDGDGDSEASKPKTTSGFKMQFDAIVENATEVCRSLCTVKFITIIAICIQIKTQKRHARTAELLDSFFKTISKNSSTASTDDLIEFMMNTAQITKAVKILRAHVSYSSYAISYIFSSFLAALLM